MSILHICNAFFDRELAGEAPKTLKEALELGPIVSQLQFLPLVYGSKEDGILVSNLPEDKSSLSLYLTSDTPPFQEIASWGWSRLIKQWAEKRNIPYEMPPWEVVKMVNAKTYSFAKSPLPGARLLHQGEKLPTGFLLKSCFGAAGRGLILSDHPKALSFCEKQWKKSLPIIAEPFVKRIIDFSTQWEISQDGMITYLGTTFCKTSLEGTHQSNIVGDTQKEEAFASPIAEHREFVKEILKEMANLGYFGPIGFDAMIYGEGKLQPVVEINARRTMGWAALMLQKKRAPNKQVEMLYIPTKEKGLLPTKLGSTSFSRQVLAVYF